jgi:hypothetical protein
MQPNQSPSQTTPVRKAYGVDLKRVPPKSRPAAQHIQPATRMTSQTRRAARKDSAVHVSLSSDSLVKQHRVRDPKTARLQRAQTSFPPASRREPDANHRPSRRLLTVVSERLTQAPPRRRIRCKPAPRPVWRYIRSHAGQCQPEILGFFIRSSRKIDRAFIVRHSGNIVIC